MTIPVLKVEVAFASDPLDDDPTYTDITDYVEAASGIEITRGRSDEFSQVQAGTLTLVLQNADGRFTPNNADSPYSPGVTVGRRVRITCDWDSTTYARYVGFVNGWPVVWENGSTTSVPITVTATDRFKRLSTAGDLVSALEHEVLADEPVMYYTLGEEDGSLAAGNTAYTSQASALAKTLGDGTLTFGQGIGPGTDEMTAAVWDAPHDDSDVPKHTAGNTAYLTAPINPTIDLDASTNGATLECWANPITATPSSSYRFVCIYDSIRRGKEQGFVPGFTIGIDLDGHYFSKANGLTSSDNSVNPTYTGKTLPDKKTHHFVTVLTPNTTGIKLDMYLDGKLVKSTTGGTSDFQATCNRLHIGEDSFAADGDSFLGTMSHVAVYDKALDADRVAAHYQAGTDGFTGDTSGDRVIRIAGYMDTPISQTDVEDGLSVLGPAALRGQNPVDALQAVATNENGVVFVAKDGDLVFHGRDHRYNKTSTFTLSADDDVLGPDTQFMMDDTYLRNDVRVTRSPGPELRRYDQDSIDQAGRYQDELSLLTSDDDEAVDAATYRVNAYKDPQPRISTFTVNLHELAADPDQQSLVADLLSMEIGDMITVDGLPDTAPASSVDLWVEGYTETITEAAWSMQITTSPVLAEQTVWKLGVSGASELGTTTVLGY